MSGPFFFCEIDLENLRFNRKWIWLPHLKALHRESLQAIHMHLNADHIVGGELHKKVRDKEGKNENDSGIYGTTKQQVYRKGDDVEVSFI